MEIRNIEEMEGNDGKKTLRGELPEGVNVIRDPYIFYKPEETLAETTVGYAYIYPGCRAGGHFHDSVEEVYHVVRGRGKMVVGNDSYTIKQGDTFHVPLFHWHSTENIGNGTLELFWILTPVKEDKIKPSDEVIGVPNDVDKEDLEKFKK